MQQEIDRLTTAEGERNHHQRESSPRPQVSLAPAVALNLARGLLQCCEAIPHQDEGWKHVGEVKGKGLLSAFASQTFSDRCQKP